MLNINFRKSFRDVVNIADHIDTEAAADRIKKNVWFKGPNVWILAFSIVIASVGLNVNSTAVIIGAMLISPLMGPIFGTGLALGTNDFSLLKDSAKNLLIMVLISLVASFLYFIISPLDLVNPTELLSRTRPTIYDVLIALFGGLAGIFENSRKEHGTVLSGVAIATALMPPLCTAGYGLAKANPQYFFGAMLLFLINCVFIILATYFMTKYLGFKEIEFQNPATAKKTRNIMTLITLAVIAPSVWSAVVVIGDNNFERNVQNFVADNKSSESGYIYDYKVTLNPERRVEVYYAGSKLSESELTRLKDSAEDHGIPSDNLRIREHDLGNTDSNADKLLQGIYERTEMELSSKEEQIKALESEIRSLKGDAYDYTAIAKETRFYYPEIKNISISRGASVSDSLKVRNCMVVIAYSDNPLDAAKLARIESWMQLRLKDSTAVLHNIALK